MQRLRSAIVVLACFGLLGSQLSGIHMHLDSEGYVGPPVPNHVHGAIDHVHDDPLRAHGADSAHSQPGSHDHDGDRDVSVAKLGAGASKLAILLTWLVIAVLVELAVGGGVRLPAVAPQPRTCREHWRPPLRAPPPLSLR